MDTHQLRRHVAQAGFTLIELIVVIIIIGILSAVAIPNFTGATDEARIAKQNATLGMLKSAWGTAYAVAKVEPTCAQIVAQAQVDPKCTGTSPITCEGVTKKDGTGSASFTCTADISTGSKVSSPALITCGTSDGNGC